MSHEQSEAVVLRGTDFSETSRVVTFLTPDRGRVACMAKGVKRPKSQMVGALDTFNRLEIAYYWKESRNVQQLGEASIVKAYTGIKKDLEKSTYAAFPMEIAMRVAHENEPSEELFAVLIRGLEGLDAWDGSVRCHCCWQVLHLLCIAGFEPSLDYCCECGEVLEAAPKFSFAGGVSCGDCSGGVALSAGTLKTLRALAKAEAACPRLAADAEVFELLRRFASQQLETEFRSTRVIAQMF